MCATLGCSLCAKLSTPSCIPPPEAEFHLAFSELQVKILIFIPPLCSGDLGLKLSQPGKRPLQRQSMFHVIHQFNCIKYISPHIKEHQDPWWKARPEQEASADPDGSSHTCRRDQPRHCLPSPQWISPGFTTTIIIITIIIITTTIIIITISRCIKETVSRCPSAAAISSGEQLSKPKVRTCGPNLRKYRFRRTVRDNW